MSIKDAILNNLEANLDEAKRRGDTKEIKRLQEMIENFEKKYQEIEPEESSEEEREEY